MKVSIDASEASRNNRIQEQGIVTFERANLDELSRIDMLLFMGLASSEDDISEEDIENQIKNLDKNTKIKLIISSLLTSNLKILSDPYIPMSELEKLVFSV